MVIHLKVSQFFIELAIQPVAESEKLSLTQGNRHFSIDRG